MSSVLKQQAGCKIIPFYPKNAPDINIAEAYPFQLNILREKTILKYIWYDG